jgi:uroporphyrinogen-III synthase
MTGLVVITRPRDEAVVLADELAARGYSTLIEPMLTIVPLSTPIPDLALYSALIFTSANGSRIFAARSSERSLPAYAVGSHTAQTLRDACFADVRDASGDARALVKLIAQSSGGGPLLHVAGKDIARDMGKELKGAGITVDRLVVYEAVMANRPSPELTAALYACTISHVLFFSARTAASFGTLLAKRGFTHMVGQSSALCISSQVAAQAEQLPWGRVETASEPNAAALIALLPPLVNIDVR